jgi:hypothetical protein
VPEAPITGSDLAFWSRGLAPADRAVAEAASGLDISDLAQWVTRLRPLTEAAAASSVVSWHNDADPADPPPSIDWQRFDVGDSLLSGFHRWDLGRHVLRGSSAGFFLEAAGTWLARPFDPQVPYTAQIPPMRLAVDAGIVPEEVLPRLLACPRIGSAVLPVRRPADALMRRAFSWPLRVGVVSDDMRKVLTTSSASPDAAVAVSDVRVDPGRVDLLVIGGHPRTAAGWLSERRPLANVVVCLASVTEAWPTVEGYLAVIRGATGAIATLVAPASAAPDATRAVRTTAAMMSRRYPLDVALTTGFGDRAIMSAEVPALTEATAERIVANYATQIRADIRITQTLLPVDRPEADVWQQMLRDPPLMPERMVSREIAEVLPRIDAAIDAATTPRLLQVRVVHDADEIPINTLLVGDNTVEVFIGPEEDSTLPGPDFPEALFSDPAVNHARLTVVLVPLLPHGRPVRTELDVPRAGRSATARLLWTIPEAGSRVQARILVLHRNRVIQTAVLGGIPGQPADLTDLLVLWTGLNHLDDRSAFHRTFVLNHDAADDPALVSHADGVTQTVHQLPELEKVCAGIREVLINNSDGKPLTNTRLRPVLIEVAGRGRDLYQHLRDYLVGFGDARRMQIVSARPNWYLPLEVVYDRPAPLPTATLCRNWIAATGCGSHCFADEHDTSVVCPAVFWGIGRVIERHQSALTDPLGPNFLVTTTPRRNKRTLSATRAAVAASAQVRSAAVARVAKAFGGAPVPATWPEWVKTLGAAATDVLVLMPHTDPDTTAMEIGPHPAGRRKPQADTAPLARWYIEAPYVTGGHDVNPLTVLLGCDTAGFVDDPAGYAGVFMQKGAGAVLATLTMINADHAPLLVASLAAALFDPGRRTQPMGELVTTLRTAGLRSGLVSALALTGYGDADCVI